MGIGLAQRQIIQPSLQPLSFLNQPYVLPPPDSSGETIGELYHADALTIALNVAV